ncbi:MAG: hypothetical protein Q7S34_02690 [bacterium]|nr:hypothetical protein [bacterium]
MGKLEEDSRKRSRRKNLQKVILSSIKVAGLLSVALVAPNALQVMKSFGHNPLKRQGEFINKSVSRLIENGLLQNDNGKLRITNNGKIFLRRLELRDFKVIKPKNWDSKWRVLIFDIPEKRRCVRARIRELLMMIGFVRLQDSVWVYPYDCEDFIKLFKADLKIGKDVLYMIVETLENDKVLKKHFNIE